MDLAELGAVGRSSLLVARHRGRRPDGRRASASRVGFGHDGDTALFLGAALAATSVGITAGCSATCAALGEPEARTVLGAAVADDVLGLVILTVVVRLVSDGSVSILAVVGIVGAGDRRSSW